MTDSEIRVLSEGINDLKIGMTNIAAKVDALTEKVGDILDGKTAQCTREAARIAALEQDSRRHNADLEELTKMLAALGKACGDIDVRTHALEQNDAERKAEIVFLKRAILTAVISGAIGLLWRYVA